MIYDYKYFEKLYFNEPNFQQLVDSLSKFITQLKLTPEEVRGAAMFAVMKAEMIRAERNMITCFDRRSKP